MASHSVKKLPGVFGWFEWQGRQFHLPTLAGVLGIQELPEISETDMRGASRAAGLAIGIRSKSVMHDALDLHDREIENQLREQRENARAKIRDRRP